MMRRKKKKKRNRETVTTELCNDIKWWIRKEPSVVRKHQTWRGEANAEENQSSWSKLFNNLILRGYLFVVTFPFGMQSNERLD